MSRLRAFLAASGATASVELALCLPFALALIFGSFEAGNYILTEHKVVKGVRDGARFASRLPFETFDCDTNSVLEPGLTQIANMTRTGNPAGGPVRVAGWGDDPTDVSVSLSCDDTWNSGLYEDRGTAPRVIVSSLVPYPSILGLLGFDTRGAVVRAQSNSAVMGR